jgi:hypothetical protein
MFSSFLSTLTLGIRISLWLNQFNVSFGRLSFMQIRRLNHATITSKGWASIMISNDSAGTNSQRYGIVEQLALKLRNCRSGEHFCRTASATSVAGAAESCYQLRFIIIALTLLCVA